MNGRRVLWTLSMAAGLAACSGNIGGGQSTLPGMPQNGSPNTLQAALPSPTASPVSASNVASVGESIAAQPLPAVGAWGGTIAFPHPSPAPSASSPSGATGPISVGVTAAIVAPADAPGLGSAQGKRRRTAGKHADGSAQGLFYITLLATADLAFGAYPAIALDVPREVVAKYPDEAFGLALFDPDKKDKSYTLAVAERDLASPTPGLSAAPSATPAATSTPGIPGPGGASSFTPPPVGTGLDAGGLPPVRIAFRAAQVKFTLKANRPVVFALYVSLPSPSPIPSASASPGASSSAGPASTSSPAGSSPSGAAPAPSPAATGMRSPAN